MSTRWQGKATLLDTRKTIPGLRHLEKYATRMGGAQNHRMGLWDAAMIKDNHVLVAGGVGEAVRRAREAGVARIICEVDRLDQIEPALAAGASHLLLDNMTVAELREAVGSSRARAVRSLGRGAARYHRRDCRHRRDLRLGRPPDAERARRRHRAGFHAAMIRKALILAALALPAPALAQAYQCRAPASIDHAARAAARWAGGPRGSAAIPWQSAGRRNSAAAVSGERSR
jgi:hypothetical protein